MSIYIKNDINEIKNIKANINGNLVNIVSVWANKNNTPTKIWGNDTSTSLNFISIGSTNSYYSNDLVTFNPISYIDANTRSLKTAACHKDKSIFIAGKFRTIYKSTDGVEWSEIYNTTYQIMSIICGIDGVILAACESGYIYYSNDELTWTPIQICSNNITKVVYGNGMYVCLDSTGKVYHSNDGLIWSLLSSSVTFTYTTTKNIKLSDIICWDIEYVNDKFIFGGKYNSVYRNYISENLTDWQECSMTGIGSEIRKFIYHNGKIYGFKIGTSDSNNYVHISENGLDWTINNKVILPLNSYSQQKDVISYNNKLIAVHGSSICTSTDGISWSLIFQMDSDNKYIKMCGI